MTSIAIDLPDRLARDAERAGLLSSDAIAQLIQKRLQARGVDDFFDAIGRMADAEGPAPMSPEALAIEIAAARAGRSGNSGSSIDVDGLRADLTSRTSLSWYAAAAASLHGETPRNWRSWCTLTAANGQKRSLSSEYPSARLTLVAASGDRVLDRPVLSRSGRWWNRRQSGKGFGKRIPWCVAVRTPSRFLRSSIADA